MGRIRTTNLRAKRARRRQVEFEVKLTRYIEAVCAAAVERLLRRMTARACGVPSAYLDDVSALFGGAGGTIIPDPARYEMGTEVVVPRRRFLFLTSKPILLGKSATALITDGTV